MTTLINFLRRLCSWPFNSSHIYGNIDERHFREAISHPTVQQEIIPKHNEMYAKAEEMGKKHALHGLPENGDQSDFESMIYSWYQNLQDIINSVMLPLIAKIRAELKLHQQELDRIAQDEEGYKADYDETSRSKEQIQLERAQEEFDEKIKAVNVRIKDLGKIQIRYSDKISAITAKMDEVEAPPPSTLTIHWSYFLFLALLALADAPFLKVVYNSLGEDLLATWLMTLGTTAALIIFGHYVGQSFKNFTFKRSPRYLVIALFGSVLTFYLCFYLGHLRQEYVQAMGIQSEALSAELLTLLSIFLFSCAVLLSYYFHSKFPSALIREYQATMTETEKVTSKIEHEESNKSQIAVNFAKEKERIKQFFAENNFRYHIASLQNALSAKESELGLLEAALAKISDFVDSLYGITLRNYRNAHNINRLGKDKVNFGTVAPISRANGSESTRGSSAALGNGLAKVVSAVLLLFLMACKPKVPTESTIFLLFDKTEIDFDYEYPNPREICTIMKLDRGGFGEVYLSQISDQFKNDVIKAQVSPARAGQNPMIRKNELLAFEKDLQSKVDKVQDIPSGRNRSMVYNPIFDSLRKLSNLPQETNRLLVVYSDLLENNSLDLYKDGHSGDYLDQIYDRYGNFNMKGIKVILVHKPTPGLKAEDRSVKAIERFESFLKRKGATFSWEGNLLIS